MPELEDLLRANALLRPGLSFSSNCSPNSLNMARHQASYSAWSFSKMTCVDRLSRPERIGSRALGVEELFQFLHVRQVRPQKSLAAQSVTCCDSTGSMAARLLAATCFILLEHSDLRRGSLVVSHFPGTSGSGDDSLTASTWAGLKPKRRSCAGDVRRDLEPPSLFGDVVHDLLGRHALAAHRLNILHAQQRVFFAGRGRRTLGGLGVGSIGSPCAKAAWAMRISTTAPMGSVRMQLPFAAAYCNPRTQG